MRNFSANILSRSLLFPQVTCGDYLDNDDNNHDFDHADDHDDGHDDDHDDDHADDHDDDHNDDHDDDGEGSKEPEEFLPSSRQHLPVLTA